MFERIMNLGIKELYYKDLGQDTKDESEITDSPNIGSEKSSSSSLSQ
jgi:hypothetical protein